MLRTCSSIYYLYCQDMPFIADKVKLFTSWRSLRTTSPQPPALQLHHARSCKTSIYDSTAPISTAIAASPTVPGVKASSLLSLITHGGCYVPSQPRGNQDDETMTLLSCHGILGAVPRERNEFSISKKTVARHEASVNCITDASRASLMHSLWPTYISLLFFHSFCYDKHSGQMGALTPSNINHFSWGLLRITHFSCKNSHRRGIRARRFSVAARPYRVTAEGAGLRGNKDGLITPETRGGSCCFKAQDATAAELDAWRGLSSSQVHGLLLPHFPRSNYKEENMKTDI